MMVRNYLILLLFGLVVFAGCKKAPFKPEETALIADQQYDQVVLIDGHSYDGLTIRNCTFSKGGLIVRNADNITIENCTFSNISGDALIVGDEGPATYLVVENCLFENTGGGGIIGGTDCRNATIRDNTFNQIGLSGIGGAMGSPHHAIDWKTGGVVVDHNTIHLVDHKGEGVHIHSGALVSRNTISATAGSGIGYLSDEPGSGDTVLIENNIIFDCDRAISLVSSGQNNFHATLLWVRFNTLVQKERAPLVVGGGFNATSGVVADGNIIINESGDPFITTGSIMVGDSNLYATSDIGFIDFGGRNLKLTANSPAVNYADGLENFPATDIDGDPRSQWILDAGADEY